LGRALARHPKRPVLLLLGAYRTDEVDAKHPLRATLSRLLTEGGAVEMALSPLSQEESTALIASSLGLSGDGAVRSLAERLHQGTLGNPFYLLELLKNLIAEGRIQRVRGEWRLENALLGNASLLPENLREAMRRRLQKLPGEVRELLELFAVCGRSASLDLLLFASGLSEENLLQQLDDAVRAKLIEETETGASAFRFVNESVRETLYDDLTPGRKRLLHAKVAARLLEQNGAHAELGRHFLRAGDKEKARRHLIKAGDQSLRAYDGKMAVAFYEEAQALGQPEAILCEKLGRAHDLAGDLTAAEHLLSLSIDQSPEEAARVWRLRALAEVKRKRGAMGEAAEALEEAMRLLGRPLPKSRFGVLSSIVGQGLLRTAHNIGLSSKVKDSEREVEAQVARLAASLTHVLYYVDYEKSVAAHLYMLNLAERLGPSEEQAMAYLYHAVALGTLGNFEETQAYLDKGRKMAEERKVKPLVERAGAYSAWLTWVQGEVSQAAERVDSSLAQHRPSDPFDLATLLYVGSASRVAMGQLDAARAHGVALERLSQETNSRYTFGTARLHQGIWLLSGGNDATATPVLEEARAAFLESGGRVYAIASAGFLGASLARRGALDRAIVVLEEASRDAERFHVKDPLVQVQSFLAEAYLRRARRAGKNAKEAARDLASARAAAKLAQQTAKIFPIQTPLALRVAAEVELDRGQEKAALALRQEAQSFEEAHAICPVLLEFSEGEG
jgi:tetratricopeptide (TPR) repeat protein